MKLISAMCVIVSFVLVGSAATMVKPSLSRQGTAVIYATDGSYHGNKPVTMLLPDQISNRQATLLNFAYDVAKSDGFKSPQYLLGLLMQESDVCANKSYRVAGLSNKPGDRYFGCGQIKLQTAKGVMARFPEMWKYLQTKTEEELQAMLIMDDSFNIRVASKLLLILGINTNAQKAITAYNLGEGGAKSVDPTTHTYTREVGQKTRRVENLLSFHQRLESTGKEKLALNDLP